VQNTNDKLWAMAIYLSSFFFVLIGPLAIWLIKKSDSEFIDYHGKEYFNFLISYTIYTFIAFILMFIGLGFIIAWLIGIYVLVFTIVAAVKAYSGHYYRIPLTIRILK
jgi:uncharacterized Tic20 family protein